MNAANISTLSAGLLKGDKDLTVQVRETQIDQDIFHFKVMELQTCEDLGDQLNKCRCLFHFNFKLIKKAPKEYLKVFDFDVTQNPIQRLYLSADTKLLMEVINGFVATVYERFNIDDNGNEYRLNGDEGQKVKWEPKYIIRRFPKHLADITSVNYLFSPNFTFQLDYNYAEA